MAASRSSQNDKRTENERSVNAILAPLGYHEVARTPQSSQQYQDRSSATATAAQQTDYAEDVSPTTSPASITSMPYLPQPRNRTRLYRPDQMASMQHNSNYKWVNYEINIEMFRDPSNKKQASPRRDVCLSEVGDAHITVEGAVALSASCDGTPIKIN